MSDETNHEEDHEQEADPRVDLAIERTELALERTHLAWIRTTFAIMTAGMAIDKGFALIHHERLLNNAAFIRNGHVAGLFLTCFGAALLIVETTQFVKRGKQLAAMKNAESSFFSTNVILSISVLLLGAVIIWLMIVTG